MTLREYLAYHIMINPLLPFIWLAKMKKEWVTKKKLLSRKQRMFIIMCVEHLAAHKIFYGGMLKSLRQKLEIKHGQSWFYGAVNQFAHEMEGSRQHSKDYVTWDKYYTFSSPCYRVLDKIQDKVCELTLGERKLRKITSDNCINTVIVMPEGDVVMIRDRNNPSGKDGTTETNCIAHMFIEAFLQKEYFSHIERPITAEVRQEVLKVKRGTGYLGDDRTASERDFHQGYLDFYNENLYRVGLVLKELKITNGPEGAQFAGYEIQRSHWNDQYYVPFYKIDKILSGLFTNITHDPDVVLSRFMAFAILMFPQIMEYRRYKPFVIDYCQKFISHRFYAATIVFWTDEQYLQRLWTGHESVAEVEGGIKEVLNGFFRPRDCE